jgi:hypothetical protein
VLIWFEHYVESEDRIWKSFFHLTAEGNIVRVGMPKVGARLTIWYMVEKLKPSPFTPDSRDVAIGSEDKTSRVRAWQLEDLITEVCFRLLQNLSCKEWRQYLGDEPYHKTCPGLPGPEMCQ